jgi:uncharacterized membrane protein
MTGASEKRLRSCFYLYHLLVIQSMKGPRSPVEPNKKVESSFFRSKKNLIMILTGILALIANPIFYSAVGILSGGGIIIMMMVSLLLGGISGYIGDQLLKNKDKRGWIGIGFMTLTIIFVLAPVLLAFF